MRRNTGVVSVLFIVLCIVLSGCVQKSEHEKTVGALNQRVEKAESDAAKAEADFVSAQQQIAQLQSLLDKFSKEVDVWSIEGTQIVSSKARILNMDTVEARIEESLKLVLGSAGMPQGGKLLKVTLKADTATVTLNADFKTNLPKDEAIKKLVLGVLVNTITEFSVVQKVVLQTVSGPLVAGNAPFYRNDAGLK